MLRINWKELCQKYDELSPNWGSKLIFYYSSKSEGGRVSKEVSVDKFLDFIWRLYDDKSEDVEHFVVTDGEGSIVHQHILTNAAGEIIPTSGNPYTILVWNVLPEENRAFCVKSLLSTIDYEITHEPEFNKHRSMETIDQQNEE